MMDGSWDVKNAQLEEEEEEAELVTLPSDISPIHGDQAVSTARQSYDDQSISRALERQQGDTYPGRGPKHHTARYPLHEEHTHGDQYDATYGSPNYMHGRLPIMPTISDRPQVPSQEAPTYGRVPLQVDSPWPRYAYPQQTPPQSVPVEDGASSGFPFSREAPYYPMQHAMPARQDDMRYGRIHNVSGVTASPFAVDPYPQQLQNQGRDMRLHSVDSVLDPQHTNAYQAGFERSPSIVLPSNAMSLPIGSSRTSAKSGGPKKTYAPGKTPGPGKASPVRKLTGEDGLISIYFEYLEKGVPKPWTLRCDIDEVDDCQLSPDFKEKNATYPEAYKQWKERQQLSHNGAASEESSGPGKYPRYRHDKICNEIGWRLAFKNPQIQGNKGVIQRAVGSFRNVPVWTKLDPNDTRSRRTKKVHRDISKAQRNADQARANEVMEQQPLPSFDGTVYGYPEAYSQSVESESGLTVPQYGAPRTCKLQSQ